VIALCLAALIATLLSGWGYDDPFITYRYAQNLRSGLGMVYNPGAKVLSTTSPLFTLLLACLQNSWIPIPRLATILGSISLALGGLFLWDLGYVFGKPVVAWSSLVLYPSFPLLLSTLGSETPLYLAFCLLAFTCYSRRRFGLASLSVAAATLTRPDGLIVGLLLVAHYLLVEKRPLPRQSVLVFFAAVLPWILFAFLYYGSPIPATLAAKQAQARMAISEGFVPGLLTIVRGWYAQRLQYHIAVPFSIIGLVVMLTREKRWILLLSWNIVYFAAYGVLGVTRYFWYYAPLVIGLVISFGLGLDALATLIKRFSWPSLPRARYISSALLIVGLAYAFRETAEVSQSPDPRLAIYRTAGEWIRQNTPSGAAVGALEVGIIGFYAQRPMIDFAGLLQPELAATFDRSTTYEDAARWSIQRYKPDYLILNPDWFTQLTKAVILPNCIQVKRFTGGTYGFDGDLVVYKCAW
jgi:hypothetical protein